MKSRYVLITVAIALTLGALSLAAQSAQPGARTAKDLFQQARHEEDATGNLDAAIKLYQQVLAAKPDRSMAAQAQLHLALCFDRLGRPEAKAAFEAVVAQYGDLP